MCDLVFDNGAKRTNASPAIAEMMKAQGRSDPTFRNLHSPTSNSPTLRP